MSLLKTSYFTTIQDIRNFFLLFYLKKYIYAYFCDFMKRKLRNVSHTILLLFLYTLHTNWHLMIFIGNLLTVVKRGGSEQRETHKNRPKRHTGGSSSAERKIKGTKEKDLGKWSPTDDGQFRTSKGCPRGMKDTHKDGRAKAWPSYIPKQIPSQKRTRGRQKDKERCLQRWESKTRSPLFPNKFSISREKERVSPRCSRSYGRKHGHLLALPFSVFGRTCENPVRSFKVVLKHRARTPESGRRQSTRLISSVVSVNYNETNGCRETRLAYTYTYVSPPARALSSLLVRSFVRSFVLRLRCTSFCFSYTALTFFLGTVTFVSRSYFVVPHCPFVL